MKKMGYLKFLSIPVIFIILVIVYVTLINSLAYSSSETVRQSSNATKSAAGEVIGVGQAVSVQVIRATKPYLFGIINLPTYAQGIGDLTKIHTAFFWSLYAFTAILIAIFIIIKRRGMEMKNAWSEKSNPDLWKRLGKAIGIGALFALVAFLISGDASSLPLGMLVAYLEFRMSR